MTAGAPRSSTTVGVDCRARVEPALDHRSTNQRLRRGFHLPLAAKRMRCVTGWSVPSELLGVFRKSELAVIVIGSPRFCRRSSESDASCQSGLRRFPPGAIRIDEVFRRKLTAAPSQPVFDDFPEDGCGV
jgi:hypothetical protein